VPIGADIQSTASKQAIVEIKVYPGKDGDFMLYDDDGISYDYEKGKSIVSRLHWNDTARSLSVTGDDKDLAKVATKLVKVVGK